MGLDREIALAWWTSGRMKLCQHDAVQKYHQGKQTGQMTTEDIEEMWRQENSAELKSLRLKSLFEQRKKIDEEIFKLDNMALINYELEQLQK